LEYHNIDFIILLQEMFKVATK